MIFIEIIHPPNLIQRADVYYNCREINIISTLYSGIIQRYAYI